MRNRMISMCLAVALLWSLFACVPVQAKAASVNGWLFEEGKWYYYHDDVKVTGWLQDGSTWYYMDSTGAMVTGSVNIGGLQHRFNNSGVWLGITSSAKMVEILKTVEGFSAIPYKDNTQYSIGYGTRCPEDILAEYQKDPDAFPGITREKAEELLLGMLVDFENAVNRFINAHGLTLQQHQFDALVMFSYNCGTSWTSETTGYFYNAVKNGATGTAFIYAICLWSSSAGQYILTERRMSEANMYLNGVYEASNIEEDGTYPENFKYVYMDGNGGQVNYTMHGYDASEAGAIMTQVTAPTGVDGSGDPFHYEFAGWYTASTGGTKVEVLDGSLENGAVLFAQWKDPNGQIVALPKGDPCFVKVKVTESVNVRSGPGTYYPKIQDDQLAAGTELRVTQTYVHSGVVWGKCVYGWVCLDYTDYADVLAGQETWPRNGTVTSDGVNVRSGPGTSNPRQYQLNTGDPVTIYEKTYAEGLNWGRLEDGNWICLDYVSLEPMHQTGWVYDGVWYYVTSSGAVVTGWQDIAGARYYFDANGVMQTGWINSNGWYYLASSGAMVTGWQQIDGSWYYLDGDGVMQTGWLYAGEWYYLKPSGVMATGWQNINGSSYYFDRAGRMQIGWQMINGSWYYFNGGGAMASGWQHIDGSWYYFNGDGVMQTGWLYTGAWYYLKSSGAMATGWQQIDGSWYYLDGDGVMQTGWLYAGVWYYLEPSGAMATGWQKIGGIWYYFNGDGIMQTGWLHDGAWYYLTPSGAMATGWIYVDNAWYLMDASGVWIG